ncbi:Hpt domain-containing protein, partial [Lysobacter sp. 2RAB21]
AAVADSAPSALDEGHDRVRVLDVGVLQHLLDDVGGDAAQVLADFIGASEQDLHGLQTARNESDLSGVQRHAHRIKGAALLVGAQELAEQLVGAVQGQARDAIGRAVEQSFGPI